jgi:hypothetical protein
MAIKRAFVFLLLLAPCAPCFSQVSISPQSPTVLDTIRIQLPASAIPKQYDPAGTSVSMASNKITVALGQIDFEPLANNTPLNWPVGPLPAGTYQVEVQLGSILVGSTQFTVLPRSRGPVGCSGCVPLWNHTDMWWNPSESGWGASIVQHGSGAIFGAFFIYADNGAATWYVLPGGHWASATEFDGDVYQTRGPQLETFDPHNVTVTLVGSAALTFSDSDPDRATLSLTIGGKTIQKAIQRQSY